MVSALVPGASGPGSILRSERKSSTAAGAFHYCLAIYLSASFINLLLNCTNKKETCVIS